jgi:acetyl esterase/lipase
MAFFRLPDIFYTKPVEPTHKLKYGKKPMHTITVRIPDSDGPFPTIITLHGGQWKSSYSAKQMEYMCEDLKQNDIVTINIEYKRLGHVNGGYPGTFHDIIDGIKFAENFFEEWKIDNTRLSLLGNSSGAHLAFCLAGHKDFDGRSIEFTPYSMIGIAGVYNLQTARDNLKPLIKQFFGNRQPLSPINMLPLNTKQLILVGEQDKLAEQSLAYVEEAQKTDDEITLEIIPDCNHFRIIDPTLPNWPKIRTAILNII